jgi:DNA-binding NtrC family response regulator
VSVAQTLTVVSEASVNEDFVVRSPSMLRLYELVEKVAVRNIPVLITGETGVGKEHVARALHDSSERRGPFVAVNCGAMPSQLVESVLFGHEKGAFTGADRQTKGVFEQADGGTLFLDEVGELNGRAQTALLRVLEGKRVARVGSTHELPVDIRIVAATHRDLSAMVTARTFREDLFYRLAGAELFVPPLRERKEEIPLLAAAFLRKATAASDERCFFGQPALAALLEYGWPGNVRQLWNAVQFAAVVHRGPQIRVEDFPGEIRTGITPCVDASLPVEDSSAPESQQVVRSMSLRQRVQKYEAALIREAIEQTGGRITEAARLLSIPVRTLNNKLSAYGIRPSSRVSLDRPASELHAVKTPVLRSPPAH